MYNVYGSNILKKYQVNMGNPYTVKQKKTAPVTVDKELAAEEASKEQDAEEILENARLEADQIIGKANVEANEMFDLAREKIAAHMLEVEQQAKEEGYRKGEELARQHYQNLVCEAEEFRRSAQEAYDNTVLSLENEMVEIILDIGRKVIGMELTQNRDVIIGLIRTSLLAGTSSEEVIVRVCPDDYEYVLENKDRLFTGIKNIREITVKKDNAMGKGDCLIETDFGSVDSSIDTQLKAVESSFHELLGYPTEKAEAASTQEES